VSRTNSPQERVPCAECGKGMCDYCRWCRRPTTDPTAACPCSTGDPNVRHRHGWINDSVAGIDTALEKEFRSRMRELVTVSLARLSELSISKASVERSWPSQGYLVHLTTGRQDTQRTLASDLALSLRILSGSTIETLWKKLSVRKPIRRVCSVGCRTAA